MFASVSTMLKISSICVLVAANGLLMPVPRRLDRGLIVEPLRASDLSRPNATGPGPIIPHLQTKRSFFLCTAGRGHEVLPFLVARVALKLDCFFAE